MSIAARGDLPIAGSCDPPVAGSDSLLPFEETMSGRSALPMPIHVLQPGPIVRFNHVHPGAGCTVSVAVDYDNASAHCMAPVEEAAHTALVKRSGVRSYHNQGIWIMTWKAEGRRLSESRMRDRLWPHLRFEVVEDGYQEKGQDDEGRSWTLRRETKPAAPPKSQGPSPDPTARRCLWSATAAPRRQACAR